MPDTNQMVPVLIGIAILMAIVACIAWAASHPALVLVLLFLIIAAAVFLARRARARSRV